MVEFKGENGAKVAYTLFALQLTFPPKLYKSPHMSISIDTLKEAISIKEEIASLESRLEKILGGGSLPSPFSATAPVAGKKTMSADAKAKIAAAARARWAKIKGTSTSAPASDVVKPTARFSAAHRAKLSAAAKARHAKVKGTSAPAPVKKKGGISAAGRAKLAAAMKARWAAAKRKGTTPTAKKK